MRKAILILIPLMLLLSCALALAEPESKAVTVMIYLTGSDLESVKGFASKDVREMLHSGFDREQVNVVLFTGGAAKWRYGFPAEESGLYALDGTDKPTEVAAYPLMNMGEADTLAFFLRTCRERFPAEDYVLILWDHGGGPLVGLCADRIYGDLLSLEELDTALRDSGIASEKKLQLIGFDACLMGSLEVATVCAPYAEYMVASQELEPGSGWSYDFLSRVGAETDGAELGEAIIERYFDGQAQAVRSGVPVTLACIDLGRIGDLNAELAPLFEALGSRLTEENYSTYSLRRQESASVARGTGAEYDLIDLRSFLESIGAMEGTDTAAAIAALDAAVIRSRSSAEGLSGLTVYFPYYNKDSYRETWRGIYGGIAAPEAYASLVSGFGAILTGEPLADWHLLEAAQEEAEPGQFILPLTPAQAENFAFAQLVVVRYGQTDDSYMFVNRYDTVRKTRNNELEARIDDVSLIAVDADGNALSDPVRFQRTGDFITLRVILEKDFQTWWDSDSRMTEDLSVAAAVRLFENAETGLWEIADAHELGDGGDLLTTDLDLDDWYRIQLLSFHTIPVRDGEGRLLPYSEWETTGLITGTEPPLEKVAGFRFLPTELTGHHCFAFFEITDTQGTTYASELIPIVNRQVTVIPLEGTLLDNETLTLTLNRAEINFSDFNPGLFIGYTVKNNTADELDIGVRNIILNGIVLDEWEMQPDIAPGGMAEVGFSIDSDVLEFIGLDRVEQVGFDMVLHDSGRAFRVMFDTDLDLSGIIASPQVHQPRAVAVSDHGLEAELLSWNVMEDGTLELETRITNNTGADVGNRQDGWQCTGGLNGCAFSKRVSMRSMSDFSDVAIPDGATWYGTVRYEPTARYFDDPVNGDDAFRAYGIGEITAVTLRVQDEVLNFELPEPIDYAAARGVAITPLTDMPVAVETDGLMIRAGQIRAVENGVEAVLFCENTTDTPMKLNLIADGRAGSINGNVAWDTETYYDVPELEPHMTTRVSVKVRMLHSRSSLPVETVDVPLLITRENENVHLPLFRIVMKRPLERADEYTADFTVEAIVFAEDGEPMAAYPAVLLPENAAALPRLISVDMDFEQPENIRSGEVVLAEIDDGYLFVLASQPLVTGEDGRMEARIPGMLMTIDGTDTVIPAAIRPEGDGFVYELERATFSDAMLDRSYRAFFTVTWDPAGETAEITDTQTRGEPFERQVDYGRVYVFYTPRMLTAGDLPYLGDMAVQEDALYYSLCNMDGKPLTLRLTEAAEEDGLVMFFTFRCKDGTGFSTQPVPYEPSR